MLPILPDWVPHPLPPLPAGRGGDRAEWALLFLPFLPFFGVCGRAKTAGLKARGNRWREVASLFFADSADFAFRGGRRHMHSVAVRKRKTPLPLRERGNGAAVWLTECRETGVV